MSNRIHAVPGGTPESQLPARRVVAFVDILGFRDFVSRMFAGEGELFSDFVKAVQDLRSESREPSALKPNVVECEELTAFSDSIVLSSRFDFAARHPDDDPSQITDDEQREIAAYFIVQSSAKLWAYLLARGMICRGGIAVGRTLHHNGIVLGEGIVRAYDLEQQVAIYPRIVIAPEVRTFLGSTTPGVRKDEDGTWIGTHLSMCTCDSIRVGFRHSNRCGDNWRSCCRKPRSKHLKTPRSWQR